MGRVRGGGGGVGGAGGGFSGGGDFAFYVFEGVAAVGVEVGVAERPGVFPELGVVCVFDLWLTRVSKAVQNDSERRVRCGGTGYIAQKTLIECIYPGKSAEGDIPPDICVGYEIICVQTKHNRYTTAYILAFHAYTRSNNAHPAQPDKHIPFRTGRRHIRIHPNPACSPDRNAECGTTERR